MPRHVHPPLLEGTYSLNPGTCFLENITHHTSVGRRDEPTVDRKKTAAEESLEEEMNCRSKCSYQSGPEQRLLNWVPANSGLTNHLEPGCQHHLSFACDCAQKKCFKKAKTSNFNKASLDKGMPLHFLFCSCQKY